ncbi:MBL fold metallo-hydrolase [Candidatus Woesearchaeota archaeon]|nr:MBL fold metallo-hydrolase [Candidatus Woesearchaeota archaeon]
MELTYYGVRGSIPSPGPETVRYGGNTSCVKIVGDELIICDAGSGIRQLGLELLAGPFGKGKGKAHILLSHAHWDHIQGFPFFIPAYVPGNELHIYGEQRLNRTVEDVLKLQQDPPCFPEDAKLLADIHYHDVRDGSVFLIGRSTVRCAKLNHPNGVLAFRIEQDGRAAVYATDTEHYAALDWKLAQLAQDASLLIYDSQYTPEEYPKKMRWGHSTFEEGIKVAKAAGVKELHLFHHEPTRSDARLDEIVERARKDFERVHAAREGWAVVVN